MSDQDKIELRQVKATGGDQTLDSPRLDYFDNDKPQTPVRGNLRGKLKIKVN